MRTVALGLAATVCALACSDPQAGQPVAAADAGGGIDVFGKATLDVAVGAHASVGDAATADSQVGAADQAAEDNESDATSADAADAKGGFNYVCKPLTVQACVTACGSAGKRTCLKDWGPCVPPIEWCGNCADDDCNGLVNEGCPANPKCAPPTGLCAFFVQPCRRAVGSSPWKRNKTSTSTPADERLQS